MIDTPRPTSRTQRRNRLAQWCISNRLYSYLFLFLLLAFHFVRPITLLLMVPGLGLLLLALAGILVLAEYIHYTKIDLRSKRMILPLLAAYTLIVLQFLVGTITSWGVAFPLGYDVITWVLLATCWAIATYDILDLTLKPKLCPPEQARRQVARALLFIPPILLISKALAFPLEVNLTLQVIGLCFVLSLVIFITLVEVPGLLAIRKWKDFAENQLQSLEENLDQLYLGNETHFHQLLVPDPTSEWRTLTQRRLTSVSEWLHEALKVWGLSRHKKEVFDMLPTLLQRGLDQMLQSAKYIAEHQVHKDHWTPRSILERQAKFSLAPYIPIDKIPYIWANISQVKLDEFLVQPERMAAAAATASRWLRRHEPGPHNIWALSGNPWLNWFYWCFTNSFQWIWDHHLIYEAPRLHSVRGLAHTITTSMPTPPAHYWSAFSDLFRHRTGDLSARLPGWATRLLGRPDLDEVHQQKLEEILPEKDATIPCTFRHPEALQKTIRYRLINELQDPDDWFGGICLKAVAALMLNCRRGDEYDPSTPSTLPQSALTPRTWTTRTPSESNQALNSLIDQPLKVRQLLKPLLHLSFTLIWSAIDKKQWRLIPLLDITHSDSPVLLTSPDERRIVKDIVAQEMLRVQGVKDHPFPNLVTLMSFGGAGIITALILAFIGS